MQTAANMAEDLRPKIEENGSPPDRTVSMRATFANLRQSGHINWFKQGNAFCFFKINQNWLVVSTPLKNMKVSWGYYSQYMEK